MAGWWVAVDCNSISFVQLGPRPKPKLWPKAEHEIWCRTHPPPTTHHHLTKTFWRVLGIVGGQDLVCRLPIVMRTCAHGFDPTPSKFFEHRDFFGLNTFF